MKMKTQLHFESKEDWHDWLQQHHSDEKEIWIVFFKKHTNKKGMAYSDAVEEALCFGWIDSIIQRIDDEKYAQKFTPRKPRSKWSSLNIKRVIRLMKQNRMKEAGLRLVERALLEGDAAQKKEMERKSVTAPLWLEKKLKENPDAWNNFTLLPPSHQRRYILWITEAKRTETIERRMTEAMILLSKNQKLGMK